MLKNAPDPHTPEQSYQKTHRTIVLEPACQNTPARISVQKLSPTHDSNREIGPASPGPTYIARDDSREIVHASPGPTYIARDDSREIVHASPGPTYIAPVVVVVVVVVVGAWWHGGLVGGQVGGHI